MKLDYHPNKKRSFQRNPIPLKCNSKWEITSSVLLYMINVPMIHSQKKFESDQYRTDKAIKVLSRSRAWIYSPKKMDETYVSVLQNAFNENTIVYLQLAFLLWGIL